MKINKIDYWYYILLSYFCIGFQGEIGTFLSTKKFLLYGNKNLEGGAVRRGRGCAESEGRRWPDVANAGIEGSPLRGNL